MKLFFESRLEVYYQYLIKPREKYKCYIFEQLFDFKKQCSNYDENKIIGVTYL